MRVLTMRIPLPLEPLSRMPRQAYPSDCSDYEWAIIEPYLPAPSKAGRPRSHNSRRDIVDAVRYVLRNGCAWRNLPHEFPHRMTVYAYFNKRSKDRVWQQLHDALVVRARKSLDRKAKPSVLIAFASGHSGAPMLQPTSSQHQASLSAQELPPS